jgi:hypothetical protein
VVTRWVRINCKKNSSLNVEPDTRDEDGNVLRFRIWSGDCPEPPGNPFTVSPDKLREMGYKPEDE